MNTIAAKDLIINTPYLHIEAGVGIYVGTQQYPDGMYYMFKYKGGKKLILKESELFELRPYESLDGNVKLNDLFKKDFKKAKEKAMKSINETAESLVELYAKRLEIEGFQFKKDDYRQNEFQNNFEFELTPSQKNAIAQIEERMESKQITNALVFGNVGSGKTFVAMSTIFKCVIQGHQAVLLVPSTVLAYQHYNDFIQYFEKYNINIALLTSGTKKSEKEKIIVDIKLGKILIVIGTQSILRDEVQFKDLKYMVCDETQKFGVKDKEKLQMITSNLDCIYLTGTIIPRDLMLCRLQLRDMIKLESLQIRKPIKTKVLEKWDKTIIKYYVEQELNNNGQIFVIYNNIDGLDNLKNRMLEINNKLKINILHGKTSKKESTKIMEDFRNQKINVLIATTVVEVGVNIPNANLMICYGANKLGLSTAMQIKGRIGRSTRQGYCLLIPEDDSQVSDIAKKRLQLLEDTDNLTGGMILSEADLKIRGGGQVLSTAQSGKFSDMHLGREYFLELLEQSIKNKKIGKKIS